MKRPRLRGTVEVLDRHLEVETPPSPLLVMGDPAPDAADLLVRATGEVERWSRTVAAGAVVSPWPPPGPWRSVALRLPKAKDELEMLVHAAASVLEPDGLLLVYGANDEGIRSAPARIEPVFEHVDTVVTARRCRLLRARRPTSIEGLRDSLRDWRRTWSWRIEGRERSWVSYPGVFAHGRLDPGTALLLDSLGAPTRGERILDFGCGSGVVGGTLVGRGSDLQVDLLDADAVALEAATENVPQGRPILADDISAAAGPYDRIVSNPPYHEGKTESTGVVEDLVRGAPERLTGGGSLVFVVQRRLGMAPVLEDAFSEVEIVADRGPYRVWRGAGG